MPSDGAGGWDNWTLTDAAATDDMNRLYQTILDAFAQGATFVIVAGHSRGAQVIYKLLRERMQDLVNAGVDPTKILFISSGNPERNHTGLCVTDYDNNPPVYPGDQPYGNGYGLLPTQTGPFKLLCITRQYDNWADTPWDLTNAAAQAAIDTDYHSKYDECPEIGHDGYPVNWDEWSWWEEGNITYLIAGEPCQVPLADPTPLARMFRGKPERNRARDAQYLDYLMREDVEKAFVRPVPAYAYVDLTP